MRKDQSYVTQLKAEMRNTPTSANHYKALEDELYNNTNSDRARVILAGSFMDNHLKQLIETLLRDDLNSSERRRIFDYEGIAGSFSAKIVMAYAFKLVGPDTKFDLDLIRLMRNEFAHSKTTANFSLVSVQDACKEFRLVKRDDTVLHLKYQVLLQLNNQADKARSIFLATCDTITLRIMHKVQGPRAGDMAFIDDEPLP